MADFEVYTDLFARQVVVALRGELDVCDASWLARALSAAAASGSRIMVDLAGLTFMDCSGVRALATARMQARQAGGDLLLAEPREAVSRLLSLVQVAGLVPLSDTAEMAAAWSVGAPDAGD